MHRLSSSVGSDRHFLSNWIRFLTHLLRIAIHPHKRSFHTHLALLFLSAHPHSMLGCNGHPLTLHPHPRASFAGAGASKREISFPPSLAVSHLYRFTFPMLSRSSQRANVWWQKQGARNPPSDDGIYASMLVLILDRSW